MLDLGAVSDPNDPRVRDFTALTDVAARSVREPSEGLFIAEGGKVILRALAAGYRPRSVLTEPKWLPDLAGSLQGSGAEILTATPDVLRTVTGYRVHRGALASFERRALPTPSTLLAHARFVVVLVDLVDHTNVGAVFRNCAALGADAVLVTPGCADPLYRRAVKVSMGTVLGVPWTRTGADPLAELSGFATYALTPDPDALDVDHLEPGADRRAVLLGTEGDGLPGEVAARADWRVRIPMAGGVDSLNVAAASAIALHLLRPRR
ncbi:MAG TPA: RNA methyltransferase [Motilibacterales bacterium]|nr:RNA methyltransferase [Motilibacterales bacterium]